MNEERFDVLAVSIADSTVRSLATSKTARDAEAIEVMAVMRRGVETEFYVTVESGKYKDGDRWRTEPGT